MNFIIIPNIRKCKRIFYLIALNYTFSILEQFLAQGRKKKNVTTTTTNAEWLHCCLWREGRECTGNIPLWQGSDGCWKEAQDPQSRPLCRADSQDFWPGLEKCKELVQELAWERAKEGLWLRKS